MKSKGNIITHNLSGAINKQLVFKKYSDKTVASKYPDMSKVVPTQKQLEAKELFAEAVAYARSVLKDPELKAAFQATLRPGTRVYGAAIKQYMRAHKATV